MDSKPATNTDIYGFTSSRLWQTFREPRPIALPAVRRFQEQRLDSTPGEAEESAGHVAAVGKNPQLERASAEHVGNKGTVEHDVCLVEEVMRRTHRALPQREQRCGIGRLHTPYLRWRHLLTALLSRRTQEAWTARAESPIADDDVEVDNQFVLHLD